MHHIRLRRGASLGAIEFGGSGRACVLLHGCGDCSQVWCSFADRLLPDWRPIAFDLSGHGDSSWEPSGRYDSEKCADDVQEALEQLNLEGPAIVGHSLGAEVVIHLAARDPDFFTKLVLVDFSPVPEPEGETHISRLLLDMPRRFPTTEAFHNYLVERNPLADETILGQVAHGSLRATEKGDFEIKFDHRWVMPENRKMVRGERILWTLLERVRAPTLLVRGAGSSILSAELAHTLVERSLLRGRLCTISGAGHNVILDNPEEFAANVVDFLTDEPKKAVGFAR